MTKKTRRRFTSEYKEQAVARLSEPGVTYASLSAELGITSRQLKTWHLELLAAGSATAIAQTKAEAAELAQLRRDNKRLALKNPLLVPAKGWMIDLENTAWSTLSAQSAENDRYQWTCRGTDPPRLVSWKISSPCGPRLRFKRARRWS